MQAFNHFLIFLYTLQSSYCLQGFKNLFKFEPPEHNFLNQVISASFRKECDILHIGFSDLNSDGLNWDKIFGFYQKSQGQYIYNYKDWDKNISLDAYDNSPKIRAICQLVIISGFSPQSPIKILLPIGKGSQPRKERDFFIYVTTPERINPILSLRDNIRIKNKIGICSIGHSLIIKTLCPHCGPKGSPEIIDVKYNTAISQLFPDFLRNFNGYSMRLTIPTSVKYRYEIVYDPSRNGYKAKRGLYKISFQYFMDKFNFTYVVFPSMVDGGTGLRQKNGTWIGAVGDIYTGNADLGFAVGNTLIRSTASDYSFPFCYELLIFTYGLPSAVYSPMAIFWTFKFRLWSIIVFSTLFAILTYGYFIKREMSLRLLESMSKATYQLLSTLLEQDVIFPKANASRILFFVWLFFSLVIVTVYKSKLVSILAFPVSEEPPQTFAALAYSDYRVGLQFLGGAAYELFATSKHPTYSTIFQRLELVKDAVTCLNLTATTKFSCVVWGGIAEFIGRGNLSDKFGRNPIINAPEATFQICSGWVWEKRSILWSTFDPYIHSFVDMGLIRKWIEMDFAEARKDKLKWEEDAGISNKMNLDDGKGMDVLGLNQLTISFYILVIGASLCLLIFGFELFYVKYLNNRGPKINSENQFEFPNSIQLHLMNF